MNVKEGLPRAVEVSQGSRITDHDVAVFEDSGFIIKEAFYRPEEIELLSKVSRAEIKRLGHKPEIWDKIPYQQHDLGKETIFNAFCFNERMRLAFEKLLHEGCQKQARWGRTRPNPLPPGISLHHRKLIVKDADNFKPEEGLAEDLLSAERPVGGGYHGGNRFLWHQDFWYWGNEDGADAYGRAGRPFPDLATCFTAIDPATRKNGCLELLRGSHKLGRVEFDLKPWGQRLPSSSDVQRVLDSGCEPVFAELAPGDAVFFHCEMLHQSAPNASATPRWAFLVCYDPMHNAPIGVEDMRQQPPTWNDDCILKYGKRHLETITDGSASA